MTVAAKVNAIEPVPKPTSRLQPSMSSHGSLISVVSAAPAATAVNAASATRRMPNRSISAAANGAVTPYSAMFTANVRLMVPCDQPNSWCSGPRSRSGIPVEAPVTTMTMPATVAIHHGPEALAEVDTVAYVPSPAAFGRRQGPLLQQWLTQQRVERARQLLEETDLPGDRVAMNAGFGTAASLRQHLYTQLGISPTAYRNTFRGNLERLL